MRKIFKGQKKGVKYEIIEQLSEDKRKSYIISIVKILLKQ